MLSINAIKRKKNVFNTYKLCIRDNKIQQFFLYHKTENS